MAVTIDGVGEINGVVLPTTSFGKILQVVRATDTTNRTTTSTSFVDVTGMSVTITPQKSTSSVLVIASGNASTLYTGNPAEAYLFAQITDSSNNVLSGAENQNMGLLRVQAFTSTPGTQFLQAFVMMAYATPATTSPVTYKMRFKVNDTNVQAQINNASATGQLYAIEVSA